MGCYNSVLVVNSSGIVIGLGDASQPNNIYISAETSISDLNQLPFIAG